MKLFDENNICSVCQFWDDEKGCIPPEGRKYCHITLDDETGEIDIEIIF